jgi:hypothetical protein
MLALIGEAFWFSIALTYRLLTEYFASASRDPTTDDIRILDLSHLTV